MDLRSLAALCRALILGVLELEKSLQGVLDGILRE